MIFSNFLEIAGRMAIVLMSPKLGVEDLVFESRTILAALSHVGMELPFSQLLNSLAHLVAKSGFFRANFRDVSLSHLFKLLCCQV